MSNKKVDLIITCPHCNDLISIEELNCKIFRHGVMKDTGKQINPHASKIECNEYITNNLVYGCAKPFRIIEDKNNYIVEICDYI